MNTADSQSKKSWHLRWHLNLLRYLNKHETATFNVTIMTNVILSILHILNLAEFRSIELTIIGEWVTHPGWGFLFAITAVWLLVFQKPPRVVWGLWVSTATFVIWGALDLVVGLTANQPVSLLGPFLLLFICAPVAWLASENVSGYAEAEKATEPIVD